MALPTAHQSRSTRWKASQTKVVAAMIEAALSAENSREGFRSLIERIETFVALTQVQVLLAHDFPLPSSPEAVSA